MLWRILTLTLACMSTVAVSAATPDARSLVMQMKQSFQNLRDYSCQTYTTSFKNGKTKLDGHKYYFKKPALIRLEVIAGGDKGAIAILNAKGKVRAKAGGILGLFTITMEPNDKRLQDKDGSRFVDSHFGGTIADIERAINDGNATVTELNQGRRLYKLEIERSAKRDIILIDPQLMLPVEWQSVRQGRTDSKTEWRDLKVDTGLQDSIFEM